MHRQLLKLVLIRTGNERLKFEKIFHKFEEQEDKIKHNIYAEVFHIVLQTLIFSIEIVSNNTNCPRQFKFMKHLNESDDEIFTCDCTNSLNFEVYFILLFFFFPEFKQLKYFCL